MTCPVFDPLPLVALAIAVGALLLLAPVLADADESEDRDRIAVLELGAMGDREISERTSHLGPAVGVEIEPIENWLEIEFGASTYRSQGATNWELELPFKKPFRVSSTIEVMPGLGPTWSHTTQAGQPSTWGAEAVIDLFFWSSKRLGWYLEPSYGVALGNGNNRKSVSLTGGIFFAVP